MNIRIHNNNNMMRSKVLKFSILIFGFVNLTTSGKPNEKEKKVETEKLEDKLVKIYKEFNSDTPIEKEKKLETEELEGKLMTTFKEMDSKTQDEKKKKAEMEKLENELMKMFKESKDRSIISYGFKEAQSLQGNTMDLCKEKTAKAIEKDVFTSKTRHKPISKEDLEVTLSMFVPAQWNYDVTFRNTAYQSIGPLVVLSCRMQILPVQTLSIANDLKPECIPPFYELKGGYIVDEDSNLIIGKI